MSTVKAAKKQVAIRLPAEMLDQIGNLAKKERRNRSNMIEWLLREILRNREKI
jgi:hypothetical protein